MFDSYKEATLGSTGQAKYAVASSYAASSSAEDSVHGTGTLKLHTYMFSIFPVTYVVREAKSSLRSALSQVTDLILTFYSGSFLA